MNKKDFIKTNKGTISSTKRNEYLSRLNKTYVKNNIIKSFYSQFNHGSGHEIETGKFWAYISSSRLAFDLYSWRADRDNFIDFEFEKKLPGIWYKPNKESSGVPNMDVYFETTEEITFIESKFTESPNSVIKLAEAYWQEKDEYHITTKIEGTNEYETRTFPIDCRYHNKKQIAVLFVQFCKKYVGKQLDKNEWFDFAQEIKHLFGIIFYVIENKELIGNRKICFYNVVYHFDEYKKLGNNSKSTLAISFIEEAKIVVETILKSENIQNQFEYELKFVQSELELHGNEIAYNSSATINELITENFNL